MKKIFVLICMLFGLVLPAYSEGAAVLPAERGAVEKGFEELDAMKGEYDYPTLVNILDLIIKCKRMSESNCNPQSIADALFIGILEVKYLCRK